MFMNNQLSCNFIVTGIVLLPLPPEVDGGCFHPCLSLSVCEQDISNGYGWTQTKLGGQVGRVTRMKYLDFGEDPDSRISKMIFHNCIISHTVMDGFG